jgi:transposase, IS30 family
LPTYVSLYVQGRGAFRQELAKYVKQGPTGKGNIREMIVISERPAETGDQAVPGHWECDLLYGTRTTAIGTLVERRTRFVMLFKLRFGINAESARIGLTQKILTLPEFLGRSLIDRHSRLEVVGPEPFTIDDRIQVYFCDPAHPWLPGANESTNGLLRQYFPKDKTVAKYTQEQLDSVAAQLNGRPRETLGWKNPAETLTQALNSARV